METVVQNMLYFRNEDDFWKVKIFVKGETNSFGFCKITPVNTEILMHGTNSKCSEEYQNSKPNTLMEDWRTGVLGWYNGIYVGLEIQDVK